MSDEINQDRRRFFGSVAMTIAAAQFDMIGATAAQSAKTNPASLPTIKPGTNTSFGALKQIDASSTLDTRKPALPMALPRSFCNAGPMTFTAMLMLPCVGIGGLKGDRPV
jgi:hypothetical protein